MLKKNKAFKDEIDKMKKDILAELREIQNAKGLSLTELIATARITSEFLDNKMLRYKIAANKHDATEIYKNLNKNINNLFPTTEKESPTKNNLFIVKNAHPERDDMIPVIRNNIKILINNSILNNKVDIKYKKIDETGEHKITIEIIREDNKIEKKTITLSETEGIELTKNQLLYVIKRLFPEIYEVSNEEGSEVEIVTFSQETLVRNFYDPQDPEQPAVKLYGIKTTDTETKEAFYRLHLGDLANTDISKKIIENIEKKLKANNIELASQEIISLASELYEIRTKYFSQNTGSGPGGSGPQDPYYLVHHNTQASDDSFMKMINAIFAEQNRVINTMNLNKKQIKNLQDLIKTYAQEGTSQQNNHQEKSSLMKSAKEQKHTMSMELLKISKEFFQIKANDWKKVEVSILILNQLYAKTGRDTFNSYSPGLKALLLVANFITKITKINTNLPKEINAIVKALDLFHINSEENLADNIKTNSELVRLILIVLYKRKQINKLEFKRSAIKNTLFNNFGLNVHSLQKKEKTIAEYLRKLNNNSSLQNIVFKKNINLETKQEDVLINNLTTKQLLQVIELLPILLLHIQTAKTDEATSILNFNNKDLGLNSLQQELAAMLIKQYLHDSFSFFKPEKNLSQSSLICAYLLFAILYLQQKKKLNKRKDKKREKTAENKIKLGEEGRQDKQQNQQDQENQEEEIDPFATPYYIDTVTVSKETDWQQIIRKLAHEMRNQLTGIALPLDNIELALNSTGFLDPQIKNNMQKVQNRLSQLEELFNNILYPQNNLFTAKETFGLRGLVQEITEDLKQKILNENIEIVINLPAKTAVKGNKNKLKQVIINLIINALQAFNNKNKSVKKKITISGSTNEKETILEVSDNGDGIMPEKIAHIFDYNFSTKKEGNGIGLSVSKEIIAEHNGQIAVESTINQGTTFTIVLPN